MKLFRALVLIGLPVVVFIGSAQADHHEEGFISLFDGETLTNWDGNPQFWSVQDRVITGRTTPENPTQGNTFLIWRGGTVDDFELRLQFKIIGGNSGIQYRSEDKGNWVVGGYQGDFESKDTYSGILYEEKGRGILAQRGQLTHVVAKDGKHQVNVVASLGESMEINKVIKKEDWNEYQIIAHGNHLMHAINGRVTCQVVDDDEENAAKSGILALQLHAGPPMTVQFKDVRLKPFNGIDLSGAWDVEVNTEFGTGTPSFTFAKDGDQLSGKYSGAFGDSDFTAHLNRTEITWTVIGSMDGQEVECIYEGKLTGMNEMKGTVTFNEQYEGTWSAKKK